MNCNCASCVYQSTGVDPAAGNLAQLAHPRPLNAASESERRPLVLRRDDAAYSEAVRVRQARERPKDVRMAQLLENVRGPGSRGAQWLERQRKRDGLA